MYHPIKSRHIPQEDAGGGSRTYRLGGLNLTDRNPTTSFLTATTLIYAIGTGIAAAAGTRLAPHARELLL